MKLFIIFFSIFLSLTTFSKDKLNVQIFNSHIKSSDFPESHIRVNPGTQKKSELVSVKNRDDFFSKFPKLRTLTRSMDQVDRDILWVRLKSKSTNELLKDYPSLDQSEIHKIKSEIQKIE